MNSSRKNINLKLNITYILLSG